MYGHEQDQSEATIKAATHGLLMKTRCSCCGFFGEVKLRLKDPHIGAYCRECGAWLQWVRQTTTIGTLARREEKRAGKRGAVRPSRSRTLRGRMK